MNSKGPAAAYFFTRSEAETQAAMKPCDRIVVSTDDEEIAEVARKYGAEVPFMRPPELAADKLNDLVIAKLGQKRADAAQPGLSLIPNATGTATAAPTEPAKG